MQVLQIFLSATDTITFALASSISGLSNITSSNITLTGLTTDTDAFLVSDGNVVKTRTGAQVLSDIGGAQLDLQLSSSCIRLIIKIIL